MTGQGRATRGGIDGAVAFSGRVFKGEELRLIQEISDQCSGLSLTELSRTVCELLDWRRPTGGLKGHECRLFLERLRDGGLLSLPRVRAMRSPSQRRVAGNGQGAEALPVICETAGELEPLRIETVRADSDESVLWRELVERHHYLGYRVPVGANLRYLVRTDRLAGRVLACLLWSSPAWKMSVRDQWIGWSANRRARGLQFIVCNSRFLVLPWAHVKGLASKILARCARQLPVDWEKRYGYRPLLLETLVDAKRFHGTCYRAANWIALGQTQGRGRMDRYHEAHGLAPKVVYVYPLCRDVKRRLLEAEMPVCRDSIE